MAFCGILWLSHKTRDIPRLRDWSSRHTFDYFHHLCVKWWTFLLEFPSLRNPFVHRNYSLHNTIHQFRSGFSRIFQTGSRLVSREMTWLAATCLATRLVFDFFSSLISWNAIVVVFYACVWLFLSIIKRNKSSFCHFA